MAFETLAMSVITTLLFLLLLPQKRGKLKALLGILMAICAAVSLVFFILMVKGSGGPDQGQAWSQLISPCVAYLALVAWGIITAAMSQKRNKEE